MLRPVPLVIARQLDNLVVKAHHCERSGGVLLEQVTNDLNLGKRALRLDALVIVKVLCLALDLLSDEVAVRRQRYCRLYIVKGAIIAAPELVDGPRYEVVTYDSSDLGEWHFEECHYDVQTRGSISPRSPTCWR